MTNEPWFIRLFNFEIKYQNWYSVGKSSYLSIKFVWSILKEYQLADIIPIIIDWFMLKDAAALTEWRKKQI